VGSGKSATQSVEQGMVPGAVMLIGGEPGIGKSTLLTQVVLEVLANNATSLEESDEEKPNQINPILYVSGEESPSQISLRIKRILENEQFKSSLQVRSNFAPFLNEHLLFVTSTDVDEIKTVIRDKRPSLVIVDSIQTLLTTDLTGAEGSVGQIREATQRLTEVAKELHVPMFLVGHVTKEGTIAGPKVLEHIVDTVLELSGERTGTLRILRAIKNRFGATDEVGVFRTVEYGLEEVDNPSELFLEHSDKPVPGSATVCVLEGTRPLLAEVQALVVESQLAMPRRVGRGIELNRIQVLAAVLQKHCRLPLGSADIFLSAAGGFTIREPAVDLGLAVAVASSLKNKPVATKTLFIGEVGLLGEIRAVSYLDQRLKEAKRLGYTNIISRKTHRYVREVLKELGLL
jgi:DNA repair protein RadA/Sms